MSTLDDVRRSYRELRNRVDSAQLATLDRNGRPEASHAPIVWHDGAIYLFLSQLATHADNLLRDPAIGLVMIDNAAGNPFARPRISLAGEAETIAREDSRFTRVMEAFSLRFGEVFSLIEPLPDFILFRVRMTRGRYVRGFGQAYEIGGEALDELARLDPRAET